MIDARVEVLVRALNGMGASPSNLDEELLHYSRLYPDLKGDPYTVAKLNSDIKAVEDPNNPLVLRLGKSLASWDFAEGALEWSEGSLKNTFERRAVIYDALTLPLATRKRLDQLRPPYIPGQPTIVISRDYERWYDPEHPLCSDLYWATYISHLAQVENWPDTSIEVLNDDTNRVVERLAKPTRPLSYPSRGLVVGYVQSGKTANFTGVAAKAIDNGYRLVIVLAGTMNILRRQTQRRLDKELVGQELLSGFEEYAQDPEFENFIHRGAFPSHLGSVDVRRLTSLDEDFHRLTDVFSTLDFPRDRPDLPLSAIENLRKTPAALMVIKKHPGVLDRVVKDLELLKKRVNLSELPALVIDDESDQASINTARPTEADRNRRTAVSKGIRDLLGQLPRAQYVGYTATPFANVFIDPNDAEDLFPKDYLISLHRPAGYMGVSDFHDLEPPPEGVRSNEQCYVRSVTGDDTDPENLPAALDSFVLSGMVKLWRETKVSGLRFRHHTMLVHVSQRVADQQSMADRLNEIYVSADYSSGLAINRLQRLWAADFAEVSSQRADAFPVPPSFDDLVPMLGSVTSRLSTGAKRILIVNGTDQGEDPDFEAGPVWKILVGGAKLSRGYTVEGLTTSYYRRKAEAADTLMQMGRWFGFRRGYRDLVRLYIGRHEPLGKKKTIDLYEAFEAVCRDEMEFRDQLERYELPADGAPPMTPMQVPPLVPQHLLPPTSKAKTFNAEVKQENFGGKWVESTLVPGDQAAMEANQESMRLLLASATLLERAPVRLAVGTKHQSFDAFVARMEREHVLTFLRRYRWSAAGVLTRTLEFLQRTSNENCINEFRLLAPQMASSDASWPAPDLRFTVFERNRVSAPDGRYKVYSEARHRFAARALCGLPLSTDGEVVTVSGVDAYIDSRVAVLIFYPVQSNIESGNPLFVSMGFALQMPANRLPRRPVWGVKVPSKRDQAVVDNPNPGVLNDH